MNESLFWQKLESKWIRVLQHFCFSVIQLTAHQDIYRSLRPIKRKKICTYSVLLPSSFFFLSLLQYKLKIPSLWKSNIYRASEPPSECRHPFSHLASRDRYESAAQIQKSWWSVCIHPSQESRVEEEEEEDQEQDEEKEVEVEEE